MNRDLIRGERCPECRIRAEHPEARFDQVAADEIIVQDSAGEAFRVLRIWLQCLVCARVWVITARADYLDTSRLTAWLRSRPYQLLPEDCPR